MLQTELFFPLKSQNSVWKNTPCNPNEWKYTPAAKLVVIETSVVRSRKRMKWPAELIFPHAKAWRSFTWQRDTPYLTLDRAWAAASDTGDSRLNSMSVQLREFHRVTQPLLLFPKPCYTTLVSNETTKCEERSLSSSASPGRGCQLSGIEQLFCTCTRTGYLSPCRGPLTHEFLLL